jgi:hypothetical protein
MRSRARINDPGYGFFLLGRAGSDCAPRSRKGRLAADDASSEIQRGATQGATPLGEAVREFGRRKNAARAGALAFRPIAVYGLQGRSKSASTGEGTCRRSPFYQFAVRNSRTRSPLWVRVSGNSVLRKCGLGEGSHTTRAGALVCRVFLEQSYRSPIPNGPKVEGTCPRCVLSAREFPDGLAALRGRGTQNRPFENKTIDAEASACTTLRANGTAPASGYPRAEALPKVRNLFEGAQQFSKVRILENAGDSFKDAPPFPRCAPKTAHLRRETGSVTGSGRLVHFEICDAMPNC